MFCTLEKLIYCNFPVSCPLLPLVTACARWTQAWKWKHSVKLSEQLWKHSTVPLRSRSPSPIFLLLRARIRARGKPHPLNVLRNTSKRSFGLISFNCAVLNKEAESRRFKWCPGEFKKQGGARLKSPLVSAIVKNRSPLGNFSGS